MYYASQFLTKPFLNEEKRNMLMIYYTLHKNAQTTAEEYLLRYPEREQPVRNNFLSLHRNLEEYGAFCKPRTKYGNRPNEHEEAVIQVVYFKG